jgi:hypothetical protein
MPKAKELLGKRQCSPCWPPLHFRRRVGLLHARRSCAADLPRAAQPALRAPCPPTLCHSLTATSLVHTHPQGELAHGDSSEMGRHRGMGGNPILATRQPQHGRFLLGCTPAVGWWARGKTQHGIQEWAARAHPFPYQRCQCFRFLFLWLSCVGTQEGSPIGRRVFLTALRLPASFQSSCSSATWTHVS